MIPPALMPIATRPTPEHAPAPAYKMDTYISAQYFPLSAGTLVTEMANDP
jgi:hypothetical protein